MLPRFRHTFISGPGRLNLSKSGERVGRRGLWFTVAWRGARRSAFRAAACPRRVSALTRRQCRRPTFQRAGELDAHRDDLLIVRRWLGAIALWARVKASPWRIDRGRAGGGRLAMAGDNQTQVLVIVECHSSPRFGGVFLWTDRVDRRRRVSNRPVDTETPTSAADLSRQGPCPP